jgi:hypothetical protein
MIYYFEGDAIVLRGGERNEVGSCKLQVEDIRDNYSFRVQCMKGLSPNSPGQREVKIHKGRY